MRGSQDQLSDLLTTIVAVFVVAIFVVVLVVTAAIAFVVIC